MYDISQAKKAFAKAVAHLESQLQWLQVGKASSSLVAHIVAETSYGAMQISQIANVSTPDAQTIKIEPWDKSNVSAIEKALYDANTGLTPQNQGDYVMVKIPALTEERRKDITKQVSAMGEDTKATIRKIRQDEMKKVKRLEEEKEISEDDKKRDEKHIDDVVKEINTNIESLIQAKNAEVMKV